MSPSLRKKRRGAILTLNNTLQPTIGADYANEHTTPAPCRGRFIGPLWLASLAPAQFRLPAPGSDPPALTRVVAAPATAKALRTLMAQMAQQTSKWQDQTPGANQRYAARLLHPRRPTRSTRQQLYAPIAQREIRQFRDAAKIHNIRRHVDDESPIASRPSPSRRREGRNDRKKNQVRRNTQQRVQFAQHWRTARQSITNSRNQKSGKAYNEKNSRDIGCSYRQLRRFGTTHTLPLN
jgi:hypothetical protein